VTQNSPHLKSLTSGDLVGLVSPAAPVKPEQVEEGLKTLTQLGFRYRLAEHAFSDFGLTSAPVEKRLADIYQFLTDPEVRAIWALRGGYGSIQLLQAMDYQLWRTHPRWFVGFSDLTAFQWALYRQTGLPSLSGFTLTSQLHSANPHLTAGMEILSGERREIKATDLAEPIRIVREGRETGALVGGTLSMIGSLCGTPFWLEEGDWIVFIEDINEPLYRIDRYFQQLKLCGFWKKVRGVILGRFFYEGHPLSVSPLLLPLLPQGIPVVEDFPYGHYKDSFPLPMGVRAVLDTAPFCLSWEL